MQFNGFPRRRMFRVIPYRAMPASRVVTSFTDWFTERTIQKWSLQLFSARQFDSARAPVTSAPTQVVAFSFPSPLGLLISHLPTQSAPGPRQQGRLMCLRGWLVVQHGRPGAETMTGRHGRAALLSLALLRAAPLCFAAPPLPNERQLQFMEMEFVQFMHFGVDTAWLPSDDFLRSAIPTYHNCNARFTGTSHDYQTEGTWPCLNASIFNPAALDTEGWMEAATALGVKEICLTAKHAGGFTLWPSQFTPYGVHAARGYRGGKGDVLKEFVASAKRWGIKVCYYMNPLTDGYLTQVEGVDAQEYARRELGMLTELLHPGSPYGPVHRLWFDGVLSGPFRPPPLDTNYTEYYDSVYRLVRSTSPDTLISPYRGDVCSSIGSLYTSGGPAPNSTNSSMCAPPSETGTYFHPTEMHGITMQEGPDGNTDAFPTYWFW